MHNSAMVSLQQIIDDFNLRVIYSAKNLDEIMISVADVTRPGLQLSDISNISDLLHRSSAIWKFHI